MLTETQNQGVLFKAANVFNKILIKPIGVLYKRKDKKVMKKTIITLLFAFTAFQSTVSFGISVSNAKKLKLNIQLNAIQYAKKAKALKIAKDLLKYETKNSDLEHVSLQVLSRPDTEEATRKVLLQVYLKQNKLTSNEKNRSKDLIKAAKITGDSIAMSHALQGLGLNAYPKMVKALECKQKRRRGKKSKSQYPVAQHSIAEAINLLVKGNLNSKVVKKSIPKLLRCFKCAEQNTALACGKAIAQFKKLDNRSLSGLRTILVSHKNRQRKLAAARLLAFGASNNKRYKRVLETGIKNRNELIRLTSATALYGQFRDHHNAKKVLEKISLSAKNESYRKQALQALKKTP
ncbi:hypothetical protein MNBD_GAMMA12-426 [hydrothermal vent metagenome]|uniref:HEAT repeat domain-containing protein n=1 Tax=hydrothermal vent metagenome TaxID=652676 RepID=A0A3B0YYC8_9ZZZZ